MLNVVALVGHTTLRYATMPDLKRAASADERARMRRCLLEACMEEERFATACRRACSTKRFLRGASADEVTGLARIVARHGGVYATHLRSEMQRIIEAMHEAGDSAFAARRAAA